MFDRLGHYLRAAFTTRWNLLFVAGGAAAALISGYAGVLLPLLAAGEVFYLANMIGNDRFRAAIDARDAKARRETESAGARQAYERIRDSLPAPLLARFERLRAHCTKLVRLAGSLTGPEGAADRGSLESLEKLLWGHLRMIWNAAKLSEFLEHTDDRPIRERVADLEERLARLPQGGDGHLRATLQDDLKTSRERLDNIAEARRKLDLVAAEIERLEAKIAALAEGAVAKRDVGDLAQRVDEVAEGMRRTDETMRQLQLPPELEELEEPPELLREEA